MKVKILPIIIVVMFLISSINVIAINADEENNLKISEKTDSISFSEATLMESGEFYSINLKEANAALNSPEKPLLPICVKTFKFPLGTKIIDVTCTPSEIKMETISGKIEPAPRPVPLNSVRNAIDDVEIIKEKDDIYQSSELYPDKWYDYSIGCGLDGNERVLFLNVRCYPVRYKPSEDTLYTIDNVDVKISYKIDKVKQTADKDYDLVIIAPRRFYPAVIPLAKHKNSMGVSTKIKTTESIYRQYRGRDRPEKIKLFIKDAIEQWNITYVLLVGGRQGLGARWYVPARYSNTFDRSYWNETSFVSDLYYADVYRYNETSQEYEFEDWDSNGNDIFGEWTFIWDGVWWYEEDQKDVLDLYPDVHVGRLVCNDILEVRTVVNKIKKYEKNAYNQEWFKKMIIAGGDTVPFGDGIWEGEYENAYAAHFLEPLGFNITKYWASDETLTNTSLIPGISEGGGFLFIAGHGSPIVWSTHWPENYTGWIDAIFNFDMGKLKNRNKQPICVVGGCHNSMFDVAPIRLIKNLLKYRLRFFIWDEGEEVFSKFFWIRRCFSWNLVRQKRGGAIASIGNTGLGWGVGGEGSIQTGDGYITTHFFEIYSESDDLNNVSLGEVHVKTLNDYIKFFHPNEDEIDRKTVEQWVLLGDPSLRIGGYPS
ncbi:hypothetical protein AYK21_05170 [Thermoplasmatales archaeon SG8-52-2]|nr:MAG: hypothetical protein AYK21_05170 [Thermoplasmatales archaeon SG8-52-2]